MSGGPGLYVPPGYAFMKAMHEISMRAIEATKRRKQFKVIEGDKKDDSKANIPKKSQT